MTDDTPEPGIVRKEIAEEALGTVKSKDRYRPLLDRDDLARAVFLGGGVG